MNTPTGLAPKKVVGGKEPTNALIFLLLLLIGGIGMLLRSCGGTTNDPRSPSPPPLPLIISLPSALSIAVKGDTVTFAHNFPAGSRNFRILIGTTLYKSSTSVEVSHDDFTVVLPDRTKRRGGSFDITADPLSLHLETFTSKPFYIMLTTSDKSAGLAGKLGLWKIQRTGQETFEVLQFWHPEELVSQKQLSELWEAFLADIAKAMANWVSERNLNILVVAPGYWNKAWNRETKDYGAKLTIGSPSSSSRSDFPTANVSWTESGYKCGIYFMGNASYKPIADSLVEALAKSVTTVAASRGLKAGDFPFFCFDISFQTEAPPRSSKWSIFPSYDTSRYELFVAELLP